MIKKKIFIYGKHGNRTPFSYPAYRKLFLKYFTYVDKPTAADFIITGYRIDFINNAKEIHNILKINPKIQLVVFSEEPLWDTLWSGDFQQPKTYINCQIDKQDIRLHYHVINHVTSKVFEFEHIPYFITTNDDYYIRYANLFSKNAKLKASDFKSNWENAKIRYAFYAEKRIGEKYTASYQNNTILGLNHYRSLLADTLDLNGVLKVGAGWDTKRKRQVLPDWHLDKLATLHGKSFIVSALENTHLPSYITEKLFDAFSVQAIPLYYAQSKHDIYRLINSESFINLSNVTVEDAYRKIENFSIDNIFIENYISTQVQLAKLFSDPTVYLNERQRVVSETVKIFSRISS